MPRIFSKRPSSVGANKFINALEKARDSKVFIYITGDRKPAEHLATVIALDVLPLFKKGLFVLGKTEKITLALYTNGGHLNAPWPLVNLIREHCDEFEVIVLDKALSAGTLITLGADKIVMPPYAYLSPIDPTANIQDGNNQQKRLEIEDVIGYIDFVKEKIGITEQEALCEIMKDLTKEISPTRLGSVNRTHSLIRRIAKQLLGLHKRQISERQSKEIIEHLTQKLYSHDYLISRKEAKEIGFDDLIEYPNKDTERAVHDLFNYYSSLLELENDLDPVKVLGKNDKVTIDITRALVHSTRIKYDFQSKGIIQKIADPSGNPQFAINFIAHRWVKK